MIKTKKVMANGLFGRREIEKNTPEYAASIQHGKRGQLNDVQLKQARQLHIDRRKIKNRHPLLRKRFGGYRIPII